MKSLTTISLRNEPWLEKWARLIRFAKTRPYIEEILAHHKSILLIDFGCGQDILYYNYLLEEFDTAKQYITYIGVDALIKPKKSKQTTIVRSNFESFTTKKKADVIVMLAVLEHVNDPVFLLQKSLAYLKPNGIIIATTPSWIAKPVLEFLSYQLGIIAKREIDEHKRYFSKHDVHTLEKSVQQKTKTRFSLWHQYFELGLNNLILIRKK